MMGIKEELHALEEKIAAGMEEAYRKMVEFKKYKKSPLVVNKDGEVVEINPDEIDATTTYKR